MKNSSFSRQMVDYRYEQLDTETQNHTLSMEDSFMQLIRDGNVAAMEHALSEMHSSGKKNLAVPMLFENPVKNEEYMAISLVTLASRAAIRGGLTSEEGFRISDVALKRIAACRTVEEITAEESAVLMELTRAVDLCMNRTPSNYLAERAKMYVADHICEKLSLAPLAKELGVSATYLSRIFKEYEHMTVGEFINLRKIELAGDMLLHSNKSILEISDYLGFSSQSYFGAQFKKVTGMRPAEYKRLFSNKKES